MSDLWTAIMGRDELTVSADREPVGDICARWADVAPFADLQMAVGGFCLIVHLLDDEGQFELAVRCGWDHLDDLRKWLKTAPAWVVLPTMYHMPQKNTAREKK